MVKVPLAHARQDCLNYAEAHCDVPRDHDNFISALPLNGLVRLERPLPSMPHDSANAYKIVYIAWT